ncbi:MAG: B-4DMT family transporter [Actinomycetota bacterium]|nr:B-4DMT family transporter [Actinomycetota bacterium]
MRTWLVRGVVLAMVHAVATVTVAALKAGDPTRHTVVEAIMLGALVGIAALWAAVDAWRDVDRRGWSWVIAALVAGWGAAVLGVVGRAMFVDRTGVSALGQALTGGAAFTALLVLVPAGLGLVVGARLERASASDVVDGVESSNSSDSEPPDSAEPNELADAPRAESRTGSRTPLITPSPGPRHRRAGMRPRPESSER